MPRGPLPDPHAIRRNASTIPTTDLPLEGRADPPPDLPEWASLGAQGQLWWDWVWTTQESAAWGTGAVDSAARRAALEDDLWAIERISSLDIQGLIESWDGSRQDLANAVETAFKALGRLCGGKLRVIDAMAKLDGVLGLTPKAKQDLRWRVAGQKPIEQPKNAAAEPPREGTDPRERLRVLAGGLSE